MKMVSFVHKGNNIAAVFLLRNSGDNHPFIVNFAKICQQTFTIFIENARIAWSLVRQLKDSMNCFQHQHKKFIRHMS